ncbi:UNKNOWN [Stylonychia lemnae]|uniref:Uncharacterized protein n=1 Tax=Stylonychia lemnae TaxID=5949 RepID=A0A078BDA7_STYLE|nr:UNKNOWN [Stylonychia lemnae]|eukprot:CDW91573.1 UNKNOWN [Stylonychia lemnae]
MKLITDNSISDWNNDLSNYRKHDFDPYQIQRPKIIKRAEIYHKEFSYDPLLQEYRDPQKEKIAKQTDIDTIKTKIAQNMVFFTVIQIKFQDYQLKGEQIYNILNMENKLKGLENNINYPKENAWKPRIIKNTRQDHNIISNLSFEEHHFESPEKRPKPEGLFKGKKIVRKLIEKDYNIISNKFDLYNEERSKWEKQEQLTKAAEKYWKKSKFDPINQTYLDPQIEQKNKELEGDQIATHANKYYKRIPVALQKIKRFEVTTIFEKFNRERLEFTQNLHKEKIQNKISFDRFKLTNDRGFDILTHQDLSQSPNRESKELYFQQVKKPSPWNQILNSSQLIDKSSYGFENSTSYSRPVDHLQNSTFMNAAKSSVSSNYNKTFDKIDIQKINHIQSTQDLPNINQVLSMNRKEESSQIQIGGYKILDRQQRLNNSLTNYQQQALKEEAFEEGSLMGFSNLKKNLQMLHCYLQFQEVEVLFSNKMMTITDIRFNQVILKPQYLEKIRDLELQIIDIKAQTERKIASIMEELPNKIDKDMKRFEQKEVESQRNNVQQLTLNQEQLNVIKDQLLLQIEQMTHRYSDIKIKLDEQDFKVGNLVRNFDAIRNQISVMSSVNGSSNSYDRAGAMINNVEIETEVKLLRGQLLDERTKREMLFFEQHQLVTQLQNQFHQQEQELLKRLKEYREDQLMLLSGNQDEKLLLERMKQEKTDNDLGFIKGMIVTLDKKIDDESSFRIRSEDDIRKWFEGKISMTVDRLNFEEKGSLDRERRMMQQLQEGLTSIAEIVRGVKEQTAIGLNEVHTLALENITELSKKIDVIKETIYQRQSLNEAGLLDVKNRMDTMEQQTFKHAKVVNDQLQKEMTRMEKIASTLEKHTVSQIQELKLLVSSNDEKMEKWKVNFEDAEGKKLLEVHSAMKILNGNFMKVNKDNKDRFEILQKEFQGLDNALRNQIGDVRHKSEVDLRSTEERTIMLIDKYFQKLQHGTGDEKSTTIIQNIAGGVSLGDIDQRLNSVKEEMKSYAERVVYQNAEKLIESKAQSEMLLEGRCQGFAVELEKRYKELIKQYKDEQDSFETDRKIRVKTIEGQLQEQLAKLKSEAVLKNDIAAQKENELRRWIEQQLKDTIADLGKIVDKKLAENEVLVRKILLKGGHNGSGIKDNEMRAMKEKNLLEYVDTMITNLKFELQSEYEEEKARKNGRLDEVTRLIQTHKSLLDEHIQQQGESLKALLKANLNEESVHRHREDEKILALIAKNNEILQKYLEAKFSEEAEKMIVRIDTNRMEFINVRDKHDNHLNLLDEKLAQNKEKIDELDKRVSDKLEGFDQLSKEEQEQKKRDAEVKKLMQDMMNKICASEEMDEQQKLQQRLDQIEVNALMNDLINKATQNVMDKKFEDEILNFTMLIDQFVSSANQNSAVLYQDFNKSIKEAFGQTMQQIQDTIGNMSEELSAAKQQLTVVTNKLDDVDINSRKQLSELNDKMEVERIVSDLVGWVAEQQYHL